MPNQASKLVLTFLLWLCSGLAVATPLRFCYEDVPQHPWTMPDGTGLNFELLDRTEKLLGEDFVYVSMPWKRCQEEVRNGEIDGIIGAADNPQRRAYVAFPTLPNGSLDTSATIYEDQFNVYLRVGGSGAWDGKELTGVNRPVAVQSGYLAVAASLLERRIKINDSIKSAEDGLRFLSAGMVDIAVLQSIEADTLLKQDSRFTGRIVTAPAPYIILPLYLAINRATYQHDPKRFNAIWGAIRTVRNSADYRKVLDAACHEQIKCPLR